MFLACLIKKNTFVKDKKKLKINKKNNIYLKEIIL